MEMEINISEQRRAFNSHKGDAKRRGIAFELTFYEWLDIWLTSGHLHERGREVGKYHMARLGDKGPYSISNVKIALGIENILEAHLGKKRGPEVGAKISAAKMGKKHTPEHVEKVRQALKGRKFTPEWRKKISIAMMNNKNGVHK